MKKFLFVFSFIFITIATSFAINPLNYHTDYVSYPEHPSCSVSVTYTAEDVFQTCNGNTVGISASATCGASGNDCNSAYFEALQCAFLSATGTLYSFMPAPCDTP